MRAGVLKALAIASPVSVFFFLTIGRPPRSPLFPYTTLFRSLPPVSKGRRAAARRSLLRGAHPQGVRDRQSTRLNSSHGYISYAAFCFKQNEPPACAPRYGCCYIRMSHSAPAILAA